MEHQKNNKLHVLKNEAPSGARLWRDPAVCVLEPGERCALPVGNGKTVEVLSGRLSIQDGQVSALRPAGSSYTIGTGPTTIATDLTPAVFLLYDHR